MLTEGVDNVHTLCRAVPVLVIHGTRKFLIRIGGPNRDAISTTNLGTWYATVLFWRPQVALFVNERTLFPVMVPLAPASGVVHRFRAAVGTVLRAHEVDQSLVDHELAEMREVSFRTTSNRSVVGVMNEFAFLAGERRDEQADLLALSYRLAHTPCGPLRKSKGFPDLELAAFLDEMLIWREAR
ncbi:MAG: DUF6933 domain-containing protein [Nitrososphaerales archaeon]